MSDKEQPNQPPIVEPHNSPPGEMPVLEPRDDSPKYLMFHEGHGHYRVGNKVFSSEGEAQIYIDDLMRAEEVQDRIGTRLPPGYTDLDRSLLYNGTVLNLPMNHPYLPDGRYSPYYDVYFAWGLFAYTTTPSDIPTMQSMGWEIVGEDEFKQLLKDDQIPAMFNSAFKPLGMYMVNGDLALMKIARAIREGYIKDSKKHSVQQLRNIDLLRKEQEEYTGLDPDTWDSNYNSMEVVV